MRILISYLQSIDFIPMKLFSGKLVVTIQSIEEAGDIELTVTGKGLKKGTVTISSIK